MIQHMEDTSCKPQNGQSRNGQSHPHDAQPDSDTNDPDVFNTVVSQQFLQVMLNNSIHHSQEAGDQGYYENKNTNRQQISMDVSQNPQDPINAHLDDHAAHHS